MKKILLLAFTIGFFQLYSQENNSCPIVENEIQELCASEGTGNNFHLPMVLDLQATDTGGGVYWYETAESIDPLPEDHLLSDGASYFAGNPECSNRIEVVVDIFDAPNAGRTTFLEFCDTDEPVDVLSLMSPSILGAPEAGGYFVPAFTSGSTIFDPAVDVSGTYEYHVESTNNVCPDDKAVVYIKVNPTPNAGEDRTITLNSDAPADLGERLGEGIATNGTWNPAFASGTNVFDPQVDTWGAYEYTLTSGTCEDTAIISIALNQQDPEENCPVVTDSVQTFCESEGTGNNYYRPAIKHLSAESDDLAWYATADSEEALSWEEFLVDGVTYYAGDMANTCTNRVAVTAEVLTSPNAGATTFINFCDTDEPVDVLTLMRPSILGAPDDNGYFTPAFASGTTIFDPSVDVSGTYKYHVESPNNTCPDDQAVVYITVNPTPNAGEDRTITLNANSAADLGERLGEGIATNGTWNPAFASGTNVFDPQVDAWGAYEYTLTSGTCQDSAIITIALNQQDPEENCPVVAESVQTFCESEGTGNNYYRPAIKHLSAESDDLAWYATADSEEALSWEEFLVDGVTYYAGDMANTCTNRVAVTAEVLTSPNAGATTFINFCDTDEPVDVLTLMRPSILGAPDDNGYFTPAFASGTTIFDPSVDVSGTYKYHVESPNNTCPDDQAVVYITVNPTPNAGEDRTIALNSDAPADLGERLGEGIATNGIWNPAFASGTNVFDPQVDAWGAYEYTLTSGACEDTAIITITLNQQDPEENCPVVAEIVQTFCESEGTGNNYYRPAIKHLSAESDDLAWYATADSSEPLSWEEFLVDGVTYYAGDMANTCTNRVAVTAEVLTSPNAGATTSITVNSTDEAFDILDFMNPSILGAPDSGGSIHPPLQSGTTIFDPSVDAGGQYKYTVSSPNETCPDDSAYIYITVNTPTASQSEVSMYPNPGNGVLNLESKENIISVRILDLQGNVIKQFSKLENWKSMNLTDLHTAMYLVEINTPKGKVVKRFIKK